jgi:hypothetical protein
MIKRSVLLMLVAAMTVGLAVTPAAAQAGDDCAANQGYYLVQYNFGIGDDIVDEGCSDLQNVRRTTTPDLIAQRLRIDCSDLDTTTGLPTDNALGHPDRQIVAFVFRFKRSASCGLGTPVPGGGIAGLGLSVLGLSALAAVQMRRRTRGQEAV